MAGFRSPVRSLPEAIGAKEQRSTSSSSSASSGSRDDLIAPASESPRPPVGTRSTLSRLGADTASRSTAACRCEARALHVHFDPSADTHWRINKMADNVFLRASLINFPILVIWTFLSVKCGMDLLGINI